MGEDSPLPGGQEPHEWVGHPALQVRRHVVMVPFSPPCIPGRALLIGEEAESQEVMDFLVGVGVLGEILLPHSERG